MTQLDCTDFFTYLDNGVKKLNDSRKRILTDLKRDVFYK